MTDKDKKSEINSPVEDESKVDKKKDLPKDEVKDELVAIQMLRNCCIFYSSANGRPNQKTLLKGSVQTMPRKDLGRIRLIELIKSRDPAQQNVAPSLYITLGK